MPARQRARACAIALVVALTALCVLAGSAGAISNAPTISPNAVVVDGAVDAIAVVGSTVVLGGAFTHAGNYTGGFASVPVSGGSPASLPPVNGTVNAVVSDGSGGWFVGGSFTTIGTTSIANLAHVTSAGAVDTSFTPSPNLQVNALALVGSTLYVGGAFSSIAGTTRNDIAALSSSTGAATSWNPNADAAVTDLVVSPNGATVYVAGTFANIGGAARAGLAALDSSSGAASSSWDPNPTGGVVDALAVSPDGATVYAGGTFTGIGAQVLNRLAALSASTGDASASWTPQPGNTVNALAVSSDGGTLYVGGTFTTIGGQSRNLLAAVGTAAPGNATTWDPSPSGSSVASLALSSDGATVYVGGTFTVIGGQSRQDLAAVSASDGTATAWQEDTNAAPTALAVTSSAVGVGGPISCVGLESRSLLAAMSTSGSLLDFNPGVTGTSVTALAASPDGSTIYAGGTFTKVGGQSRTDLAAVALATGVTTSWNPAPGAAVTALAVSNDGSVVYVGMTASPRLAAYTSSTGTTPSGWTSPTVGSGAVYSLALTSDGSTLIVAGSFTSGTIGGTRLAGLNASTGANLWNGNVSNGTVYAAVPATVGGTTTVYLGGSFTGSVGGSSRTRLAAVDGGTGAVSAAWTPTAGNGQVNALAVSSDGSTIYATGTFTSIDSTSRNGVASISSGASLSTWNPDPDTATVDSVAVSSGGIVVGGTWTSIGGATVPDLGIFTLSVPVVSSAPTISGTHALGSTLTCSSGSWSNSPTSYAYQWLRGGSAISGATSSTYGVSSADVGDSLSCQVTATNGEGSGSSTSSSVLVVATPTNTTAPMILGTAAVGSLLTCDPGTWTSTPTYSYTWLRDGAAVSSASAATYTATTGDAGHALSCRVSGANDAGSAIATSAGVVIPASASTGTSTPPQAASGGTAVSVTPGAGGTLATPDGVTATWQAASFSAAGTLALTPYVLGGDVNGFGRTSPIVSLAYTSPGASVPAPVFLVTPVVVVFPKAEVPPAPFVAYSEDGLTYTPLPKLAKDALPAADVDGYFVRPDGSIAIWTRHTSLYALLRDVQPPTRPTTLVATLRGKLLRLRWSPSADNSRVIARYEIVRGKNTIVAKEPGTRTSAGFSLRRLKTTSIYRVRAVDAAGNAGALSPSIRVVVSRGKVSLRP